MSRSAKQMSYEEDSVEVIDEIEPVERKSAKHVPQTDSEKRQTAVTSAVNFFNTYYKMNVPEGKRRINFKVADKKSITKSNILIDMNDYAGISELREAIPANQSAKKKCIADLRAEIEHMEKPKSGKKSKEQIQKEKELERLESEGFEDYAESVIDPYMFTYINHAMAASYKHNDVYLTKLMLSVGLNAPELYNCRKYIECIDRYLTDEKRIKTKLYNITFDHALRNPNTDKPNGANKIYLQRMCNYHDEILKRVVDGDDMASILKSIRDDWIAKGPLSKIDSKEKARIKKQLENPEIIAKVMENKNMDWVKDIMHISGGSKKADSEPLRADEKKFVKMLLSELYPAKTFINIILSGASDNEDALQKHYETYSHKLKLINEFYEKHKNVIADAEKKFAADDAKADGLSTTAEKYAFIKYLVETICFLTMMFNYRSPMKQFISDIRPIVILKFGRELRSEIESYTSNWFKQNENTSYDKANVKVSDDFVRKLVDGKSDVSYEFDGLNVPRQYRSTEKSIYTRLGKYACLHTKGNETIGIGLAIMKWLVNQIENAVAKTGRRKDITIYIKG